MAMTINLVTQEDLKTATLVLQKDMKEIDSRLEAKIAETKADLIKWVIGIAFAQTALLMGVLKLHV